MSNMRFKYCVMCNCGFFYRRESAKYCSPACKEKAARIRRGQPVVTSEAARKTIEGLSERVSCPHCNAKFWQNTTGRKRVFCSDSCRVSANRFKKAAAFKLVRWLNGTDDYTALKLVETIGTGGVDELALPHGIKYNYWQRTYTGATPDFYQQVGHA